MASPPRRDLLGTFTHHRVSCNLLMAMMILAGLWGLSRINTQFFPNFALDFITVRVAWTGASAEDVAAGITTPIEQELRTVDGLRRMTSTSAEGASSAWIEFDEGTDMGIALDQVKERVALVRNLPSGAENPEISRLVRHEPVARLVVTGPGDPAELRAFVRRIERELLERGIARIGIRGLPAEELAIQIPIAALSELEMSLADIAEHVARWSRDLPAGTVGRDDVSRQLRGLEQRRRELEFERLPLIADEGGGLVVLADVAEIERRPRSRQTRVRLDGRPAVELHLSRAEHADSLASARILTEWLSDNDGRWPPGVEVRVYDESWKLIRERILLLLKNGAGGLALVVLILFLFLNGRVALWVAVGIPVSFMATLGMLYWVGGSINMVSLFALIMALGIIVDDAIVVGEDALDHYQRGAPPGEAAESGARRMLAPVVSSSLTTIAAFLPLMLVGGIIGNVLFDIPMVVVCVIVASLVESFLVLPGHLRGAFEGMHAHPPRAIRRHLDQAFERFRERGFRPVVRWAVVNPWTVLSASLALLLLTTGLVAGGRISFNFFPSPEGKILYANASFVAGTPPGRVERFIAEVETALRATEAAAGEPLVEVASAVFGTVERPEGQMGQIGDHLATLTVELVKPDQRSVRNPTFIAAWRERIDLAAGIESFSIVERRAGPPGRDIEVRLSGADAGTLKQAGLTLIEALGALPGVIGIEDDMPFGQEQLIYRLTPEARVLGLTVESVGRQLRAAYDGSLAQIFQDAEDEVEVRVVLPDRERHHLASLEDLQVFLPGGGNIPLGSAVSMETRRGFDILRRTDGRLAVKVSADIDPALNNANKVVAGLEEDVLPGLVARFGVQYAFEGRQEDQAETLADMRLGGALALAMIYLVLAWVFSSYGWPLVVMAAIPFGLIGALGGHWLIGLDLTLLSLFGLFGLSGIVVNDSIILVMFYKQLVEAGMGVSEALEEAACRRLRAVVLTSLTTIAGLTPLMFETSLQAQLLIPMATSITFGLGFATVLVLLVIPALLRIHEDIAVTPRHRRKDESENPGSLTIPSAQAADGKGRRA